MDKINMDKIKIEDNTYLPLQDEPVFMEHQDLVENQNIYITSDEKAKEGDWGYIPFQGGNVKLVGKYFADDWKKIILTTDQDLINNGVQAIDDEFLEWFVKNPSCDEIYVNKIESFDFGIDKYVYNYKIIIPKEEPELTNICIKCGVDLHNTTAFICQEHPKNCKGIHISEETLREWADKEEPKQERSYSEEDLDAFRKFMIQEQNFSKSCLDVFVEQLKKK